MKKLWIGVLGVILILGLISFFTLDSSEGSNSTFKVGNSTFKAPGIWEEEANQESVSGDSNVISLSYDGSNELYLYVKEFKTQEDFNSDYNLMTQVEGCKLNNMTIAGINVKNLEYTFESYPRDVSDHYFQKNNKFYNVAIVDYRAYSSGDDKPDQKTLDDTLNTVISTIN